MKSKNYSVLFFLFIIVFFSCKKNDMPRLVQQIKESNCDSTTVVTLLDSCNYDSEILFSLAENSDCDSLIISALLLKSVSYVKQGEYNSALIYCNLATKIEMSNNIESYLLRAHIYMKLLNYEDAKKDLIYAKKMDSNNIHLNLVYSIFFYELCYSTPEFSDSAYFYATKLLKIDSSNTFESTSYLYRALARIHQNRKKEALTEWNKLMNCKDLSNDTIAIRYGYAFKSMLYFDTHIYKNYLLDTLLYYEKYILNGEEDSFYLLYNYILCKYYKTHEKNYDNRYCKVIEDYDSLWVKFYNLEYNLIDIGRNNQLDPLIPRYTKEVSNKNRDQVILDCKTITLFLQQYYRKPKRNNGGGKSFDGVKILPSLKETSHGKYYLEYITENSLTIVGIGIMLGNDNVNPVKVKVEIIPDSIKTIRTIN